MVPDIPIVLASASPRRIELLKHLVKEFTVRPSNVDEESMTVADPWETAKVLAVAKSRSVAALEPGKLVIGSDTVVALDDGGGRYTQLAKPVDRADAGRMLRALSGRCHLVITGVALAVDDRTKVDADTTSVCFREFTDDEIWRYVDSGEPMDKAGAYAIQGGAAGFVERTEGSISNVVGLPLELLERMLAGFRADFPG